MFRPLFLAGVVGVCLATNPSQMRNADRGVRIGEANTDPTPPQSAIRNPQSALHDPVGMLESAARRYAAEVKGFRAKFRKQERIGGVLHPAEEIRLSVREAPYAVRLLWTEGARAARVAGFSLGTVEGVLYAAGENGGQMLAWRPGAFLSPITPTSPTGDAARQAARYAVTEAGLGHVVRRTWRAWDAARQRGELRAEYQGSRPVPEVGGRVCHILKRTCVVPECDPFVGGDPRPDPASDPSGAFAEVLMMLDVETGLQLGSEQRDAAGGLVAAYYFRDVERNPAFAADEFKAAGLRR